MSIQINKQRERRKITDRIPDRFWDGRIIDEGEMYDRLMLYRQMEVLLRSPQKETLEKVI